MSATSFLPFDVLPEDSHHPVRPDLPFLRHLTFAEGHAIEIGIGVGVVLYVAAGIGMLEAAFPIALGVLRIALGLRRRRSRPKAEGRTRRERATNTSCDHTLGIHDIQSDPWYFVIAGLVTVAVLSLTFGVPVVEGFQTVGGLA